MVTSVKWLSAKDRIAQELEQAKLNLAFPIETPTTPTPMSVRTPQPAPTQFQWETPEPTPAQNLMASQPATTWQPTFQPIAAQPITQVTQQVVAQPTTTQPVEQPLAQPFWKRALEVFAAPFQWVQNNIINPVVALAGTTVGYIPKVERNAGEDYWDWQRRSLEGWKAPGVELNVPWSDKPWNIDLKGIMELAPWLLVPGVGSVGGAGGVGARGLAGWLGKLGTTGKVTGIGLEWFSPWGLAEKTLGAATGRIIKTAGQLGSKVEASIFGKIPEALPPTPAVIKLKTFFDETTLVSYKEFQALKPEMRMAAAKRITDIRGQFARGEIDSITATKSMSKATAGALKPEFALTAEALAARQTKAIAEVEANVTNHIYSRAKGDNLIATIQKNPAFTATPFSQPEVKEILNIALKAGERDYQTRNAAGAMLNLLTNGELPMKGELRLFARIYGTDFAESLGKFINRSTGGIGIVDTLNVLRAVVASVDLSATFRQALVLGLVRPQDYPRAFARQLKAFASEKMSFEMDNALRNNPLYDKWTGYGVQFTNWGEFGVLKGKEEAFFTNLADRLPFIRRSERAYTTMLNEMRMSACEAADRAMTALGATEKDFRLMAEFINLGSGRGTLPFQLEKYSPALNTILFSPKYQMSILQMPRQIGRMLISKNPYVRKEGAFALTTFVGGGVTILSLFNASGVGKVETDPRSVDFGKLVIGDTRVDIWKGYVQYLRFAAQMLTDERKSAFGNMSKADRGATAARFLQSKSSPALGLITDLLKGENYQGQALFNDTTGFIKVAKERLVPLAIQDMMDAIEQYGMNGMWWGIPAALGVGVLTYVNDFVKAKEKIANQLGYKSWDDIDPATQRKIENTSTEYQIAQINYDRQTMGTQWGDYRLAQKAVDQVFRDNVDKAVAQFQQTGDGYTFREKISDAFTARRGGYDARDKMPQFADIVARLALPDTTESLVALGPEQLAIKIYNEALYGDDMYDQFGDYRFDEAEARKQQLRQQLGEELFKYVEDYQGLKYQTFPAQFRDLQNAKMLLKPYWDIQTLADKYFKYDTPSKQAFIARRRKAMLRTNPQMRYYHDLYYVQQS